VVLIEARPLTAFPDTAAHAIAKSDAIAYPQFESIFNNCCGTSRLGQAHWHSELNTGFGRTKPTASECKKRNGGQTRSD
jgi:hypothetical protein